MNFFGRDLKLDHTGDDVRQVQDQLAQLGVAIPDAERSSGKFGPATHAAIMNLQGENGLPLTGVVDSATADLLAHLVQAASAPEYVVSGHVYARQRAVVYGLDVFVVDKNAGPDVTLARGVTDQRAGYSLRYSIASLVGKGKSAPDIQVQVRSADGTLLGESLVRYNASASETLDITLTVAGERHLPSEYETLLAALGAHYTGSLADLQEGNGRSDITYLANKSGWDARAVALAALAAQHSRAAAAGTISSTVTGSGAANKNVMATGLGSVDSAIHVDGAKVPPEYFYALFRAGVPAKPETYFRMDSSALATLFEKAANQGVVPTTGAAAISDVVQQFQRVGAQVLLTTPIGAGSSPLQEVLFTQVTLNLQQQQQIAQMYLAYRANKSEFWAKVEQEFGAEVRARLQVAGKLAWLTVNNAPLMQALYREIGGQGSGVQPLPMSRAAASASASGAGAGFSVPGGAGTSGASTGKSGVESSAASSAGGVTDAVQLVAAGFHKPEKWKKLLTAKIPVPSQIQGAGDQQRANYAAFLASQLRVSYPTASVAQMVSAGELPVQKSDAVSAFLSTHQADFSIGAQPVEQFIARKQLQVDADVVSQIKRIQRVQQLTTTDQAMTALLKSGLDAAYHIVQQNRAQFVATHAAELGGAEEAQRVYGKAVQIHGAVLNVAMSYLTGKSSIPLGNTPLPAPGAGIPGSVPPGGSKSLVNSMPHPPGTPLPADTGDVIAYQSLERLFGSMDFCACEECRSILSPAAYLVDLLLFTDHAADGLSNAQSVLLERRPDLQYLPLTCENTNTPLPYVDLVNETMEYYIANNVQPLSLQNYQGHDTGEVSTDDLMASPQNVMDAAYQTLQGAFFPAPLPFHQPLENLRRNFQAFDVPLGLAMERLRKSNDLERGANSYGWRDILMEKLGLSRQEHRVLTNTDAALTLRQLYGFDPATLDADVSDALASATQYARRVNISYDDLVALLETRFINPNVALLPKLKNLGVNIQAIQQLHDGTLSAAAFKALFPTGAGTPKPAEYGGNTADDIVTWVNNNYANIMNIITLVDPTLPASGFDFSQAELRYAKPMANPADKTTRLTEPDYTRLLCFIRIWKKLGWTIEQTDAALCGLFRADFVPVQAADLNTVAKLDAGFLQLLPRLGLLQRVISKLNLKVARDLSSLLACWAGIGTVGEHSLYQQMFLNPAMVARDTIFADNGYGEYLTDATVKLSDHAEAVRGAFNLTGDEFNQIIAAQPNGVFALTGGANTPIALTLPNLSVIFRFGWLARQLHISVRELILFRSMTGLDPFAAPVLNAGNPVSAPMEQFIDFIQLLKARGLKTAAALYLMWNQDLSGKSAPTQAQITEFARTLRGNFADIDAQFAAQEDPNGDVLRARMTLVYGQETSDAFFALLNNTISFDVPYTNPTPALLPAIVAIDSQLTYDDFRRRLSHTGLLAKPTHDALVALAGTPAGFGAAVDALYASSQDALGSFFARYPELKPIYDSFALLENTITYEVPYTNPTPALLPAIVAVDAQLAYDNVRQRLSHTGILTAAMGDALKAVPGIPAGFADAVDALYARSQATLQSALLAMFSPLLANLRKREQALERLATAASLDVPSATTLLAPDAAPWPLHANGDVTKPVLQDVLAVGTPGFAVSFYDRNTATGIVNATVAAEPLLDYSPTNGHPLRVNAAAPGNPISGIWDGMLETPDAGYYNLVVEADAGANVTVRFDNQALALVQNATVWRNQDPLPLTAGKLYAVTITVQNVTNLVRVQWENQKRSREVIPARYLYPSTVLAPFGDAYIRFLKVATLMTSLQLTANEMAHFAVDPDFQSPNFPVANDNWPNALATTADPAAAVAAALLPPLVALLDYARIKSELGVADESLLACLVDPVTATQQQSSLLFTLTLWNRDSLSAVLTLFTGGANFNQLLHFAMFRSVYDAFALIQAIGISASKLIAATTNDPAASAVRDFQSSLRARYSTEDWRSLITPINNDLRILQRDALVAYILQQMQMNPASAHIDTPDKLFEYFLMDVEMEACMQTSRVRFALSTVQLFIERILLNLEPRVSQNSIDPDRWKWMKRYRVWEANRKVFLFPENWLEPELRDDKSPIFKEIESRLLQSDITDDAAEEALLTYLSRLSEVAKLEPCGMYVEENGLTPDNNTVHVVARSAGAHRKYYYRRREAGYWTPWEQIKLEIEDNPIIPVVWQNRLLLFWLKIFKQAPLVMGNQTAPAGDPTFSSLKMSDVQTNAKTNADANARVNVQAVLYWSEFHNGQWQAPMTSDINQPLDLGSYAPQGVGAFDRSWLDLISDPMQIDELPDQQLRISVMNGNARGAFLLYNTHTLPDQYASRDTPLSMEERSFATDGDFEGLYIQHIPAQPDQTLTRIILQNAPFFSLVSPLHPVSNQWDMPFFFADQRNVFYVTTTEQSVWVPDDTGIGVVYDPGVWATVNVPPLVLQAEAQVPPRYWGDGGPIGPDPAPDVTKINFVRQFVSEDAYISRGLGTTMTVQFNGTTFGPSGAATKANQGEVLVHD